VEGSDLRSGPALVWGIFSLIPICMGKFFAFGSPFRVVPAGIPTSQGLFSFSFP
ncbi:hypothetical protein PIB30_085833, partial [Stylosanthes scabra]|nr:hypothetical protein [Stylosanthes scabra]